MRSIYDEGRPDDGFRTETRCAENIHHWPGGYDARQIAGSIHAVYQVKLGIHDRPPPAVEPQPIPARRMTRPAHPVRSVERSARACSAVIRVIAIFSNSRSDVCEVGQGMRREPGIRLGKCHRAVDSTMNASLHREQCGQVDQSLRTQALDLCANWVARLPVGDPAFDQ